MQIELNLKRVLIGAGVVLPLLVGFAAYHTVQQNAWKAREVELMNDLAAKDKTIEIKEGLFQKSALQKKGLEDLLSGKEAEIANLKEQLDSQGAELLTVNTLVVRLRKDLASARENVPTTTPNPEKPGVKRLEVDTEGDLDPFLVSGRIDFDCDTSRASVKLGLSQRSPITLTLVVSQDKDGTWRSSATSSTKTFELDIALAAVNPYMLERKWYEKIGLGVDIGVGTNPGFLLGLGAYYEIGKFEVGPRAWMVVDRGVSAYFGAQLLWHPFAK